MAVISFFNILFAGYAGYCSDNRIFLNQNYTDSHSERQKYDLVIPKKASGDLGLVLCIHGGGWIEGSKDEYTKSLFQVSEEKGLAAACMNYRYVSDTVGFEDILDDISSALSAIREKGKKYGVNINKVLLTGISAGGHLSLLYAYTKKDVSPIEPVCVVELCGPTDLENGFYYSEENIVCQNAGTDYFRNIIGNGIKFKIDMNDFDSAKPALKKYSPVNFVSADTIPTVFGHGEQDTIVPYGNSVDLDKKLTEFGIEHTFVSFPDSDHSCANGKSLSEIMKLFFEYADKYLK